MYNLYLKSYYPITMIWVPGPPGLPQGGTNGTVNTPDNSLMIISVETTCQHELSIKTIRKITNCPELALEAEKKRVRYRDTERY